MEEMNDYERKRAANIAANKAILASLKLDNAGAGAFFPKAAKPAPAASSKEKRAKPVQPSRKKREVVAERNIPTRSSTRLKRGAVEDPDESPDAKKMRLEKEAEERRLQEEETMRDIERRLAASRPRHHDLNLTTIAVKEEEESLQKLQTMLRSVDADGAKRSHMGDVGVDEDVKGDPGMEDLKERFSKLVVKSRAKVTEDRIYCAVYHPERTKDLIFFGDKHGQLGIWDAQAPSEQPVDDDDEEKEVAEGGEYWRLQPHWPATSKSSISSIKIDPMNAQCVYTTAYDCTLRHTSFESGISREIFSLDNTLLSTVDITPSGHELWVSDVQGGLTHLDIREPRHKAVRWSINESQKIGCVSINPASPNLLVTASNDRTLKLWDSRKLPHLTQSSIKVPPTPPRTSPSVSGSANGKPADSAEAEPFYVDNEDLAPLYTAKQGKPGYGLLKAQYAHGMSVSSAYWDPSGRKIVSTSYDDNVRVWDLLGDSLARDSPFQVFKPRRQIGHNCQTGRWLTILRAQWSPNPDVHPHFTIGNMEHSLDVFSHTGETIAKLYDSTKITAVQAVTCSHPSIVERAASGNASGRCILWAPADE